MNWLLLNAAPGSKIEQALEKLVDFGMDAGKDIFVAILIYSIGRFIIRQISILIAKVLEKRKIEVSVQTFLKSLVKILLNMVLAFAIISKLGVETTSFAALLASAGVAASESVYIAMKEQGYPIHIHCLVPAYVKTTIHLADLHRPERFAMNDDPYYTSDEYKAGQIRGERGVMSGIPDWYVGECVFTAVEDEKFYIFTHPESQVVAQPRVQRLASGINPQT